MSGLFAHTELNTSDVPAAKKFYKKLFPEWTMKDESMGPGMKYTMLNVGKKGIGGMQTKQMPEAPSQWVPYVEVADVKKTMAKAELAGATVYLPYMEIMGGHGAIGVFADPTGATIGVWGKVAAAKKPAKKKSKK